MPPRNEVIQKPRNAKGTLRRLGRYLWQSAPLLILALGLSVAGNLFQLIGPTLCGKAIDAVAGGPGKVDFDTVFSYARLMVLFYAASAGLGYLVPQIVLRISQKTVRMMRADLFAKLMRLPVQYFDTRQTGDILSHISYDIDTVNTSLSNDLVQILTSVITVAGALSMMIRISPLLVLVFAVTVPLSVLFTRFMTRRVRPLYHDRSKCLGEMNGFVEEYVSGQKTIRAYHREAGVLNRFDEKNEAAVESYYRAEYYASITGPSVNFINNLSLTLISLFGTLKYLTGGITLGNISSFVLYSRKFSGPINEAANIFSELQSALAAAERVFELMDEPEEPADLPGAKPLDVREGQVDIEHLNFGYDPHRLILRDVNLTAAPGSMIAIVGPTGAGKTTVVNLLMRFFEVNSGRITIDGVATTDLRREDVHELFGMVLQDTWLFEGTIRENLVYNMEGITDEQLETVCKACGLDKFVHSLPQGFDTVLSESTTISAGQKQLLTIARAMLQNAPMLILDEATSSVDTRTELLIQRAMDELTMGRTSFVIAHRLSTIKNADLILVLKDGDIIEQGTHKELLRSCPAYLEIAQSQLSAEELGLTQEEIAAVMEGGER